MARSFITGASGFIGYHMTRQLVERGDEVVCLVRRTSNTNLLQPLGVRLIYGDVTEQSGLSEAIRGCDQVYHIAGRTISLHRRGFFDVNQRGTYNILAACATQSTSPTVVIVSSLSAIGPAPSSDRPLDESAVPAPTSYYGRSKLAGEQVALKFADRLPITIVRPAIVLGENDRHGLLMFSSIAKTSLHIVPGLGRYHYSVIHAADLVKLFLLAAERGTRLQPVDARATDGTRAADPTSSESNIANVEESKFATTPGYYHAASERNVTYSELGRLIGDALGVRTRIVPTPPRAVWVVAAFNQLLMQITRRTTYLCIDKAREIRAGHWIASSAKAKTELGFEPDQPLETRLEQTAQWYRREGLLARPRRAKQKIVDSLSRSK